ncbi:hypothetical protein [Kitasatospora sp. NPDC088346]|uniref:hypothetical protein n=1 Tax=Kitasatospora sp. NPDC088346 TaxID=3364073 RepID=UPI003814C01E
MADRNQAGAADVDGLLVGLKRTDAGSGPGGVSVSLDYSSIEQAYGGGWASRLRLVAMPACALTTPQVAACRVRRPIGFTNDPLSHSISGEVRLTGTAPTGRSVLAAPAAGAAGGSGTVVAAVAGTGGSQGDYTATALSSSGSWTASSSGAFTYDYPVAVPPSLGGAAPSVGLSYDSQAVDGETSARNSQSSWIGDGWAYSPGYIERSYKSCGDSGIKDSADECWAGWNATLSLGSHSGTLVRDADGVYHLQSDDGTKVERLTGASNGLWQGEYFKVTTTDGTASYLGLNHAPGTTVDALTNRTLVAQVTSSDRTKAGSPAQVVAYTYSGGAAWHRDDSELTDDRYRTWNDFRGFRTITTTSGAAPDPISQSTASYLQGMDGDYKADGTRRSVRLTNSLGESILDGPWLSGAVQESALYTQAGGSVVSRTLADEPVHAVTVGTPRTAWTSQDPAPAKLSTLPDLSAGRSLSTSSRAIALMSDNATWRTTKTATVFDDKGRPVQPGPPTPTHSAAPPRPCRATPRRTASSASAPSPPAPRCCPGACGCPCRRTATWY